MQTRQRVTNIILKLEQQGKCNAGIAGVFMERTQKQTKVRQN